MNKNTIFTIFLILSIQFLNTSCETNLRTLTKQTKMINVGYLSYTYDIYQGNPNPTKGFDPGFDQYPVFNFQYNQKTLTADGRYMVPDNVNVIGQQICNLDFTSSTITGSQSYTNSLSVSVSVSGGYGPGSFSASADYKSVTQGVSSSTDIYLSNQGVCSVYSANVDPTAFPLIDSTFLSEVKQLPATYTAATKNSYMAFLQKHGTHYFQGMNMGAKYGYISTISQNSWSKLTQQGITVSAAASYSAMVSVGVKAMTSSQKSMASTFDSSKSSYKQISIGSTPPPDGSILSWANNCYSNPMPITYTLDSIANLFVASFMTGVSNVAALQTNINSALKDYCGYLQSKGILSSCSPTSADEPLPKITNACRFCAVSCGNGFTVDQGSFIRGNNWPNFVDTYDKNCAGSLGNHDLSDQGAHLCCQPESTTSQGSCRLCNSCGGSYNNDGGSLMVDQNWLGWTWAYDDWCNGDQRERPQKYDGKHLCCTIELCSLCVSCGGSFPQETGVIGVDANWPSFYKSRGSQCSGGLASNNYNNGLSYCCKVTGT